MNDIICIIGTTASGKTELSVRLATQYSTEIISADSVQVYKGLDIGSAKPTVDEMNGIRHHMISCINIDDSFFSVSEYRKMVEPVLKDIYARHKIPILVGGSGLYVSSVISPLTFAVKTDSSFRKKLESDYDMNPIALYERLEDLDSVAASRIHLNDKKRVVRALEVMEATGKKFSEYAIDFEKNNSVQLYNILKIGIDIERDVLYQRINCRVDQMINNGLLDEAERIYNKGYNRNLPAMQSIGYKELFSYFDGDCALEEALDSIKQNTRRYAKRQLTWYRRDPEVNWIKYTDDKEELFHSALSICDKFLEGK